jgi:diacylglycerol kinase (ATP)
VHHRIALVVNPAAGKGKGAREGLVAAHRLRDIGCSVDLLVGRDAAGSAQLARRAVESGVDALVVVGGDGMVHLALQALRGGDTAHRANAGAGGNANAQPSATPLGIVPAGSGNDFARALGLLPHRPEAAADVIAGGVVKSIDLGLTDGQWFGGVLSSGFDSRVNERANRMRWPRGPARYNLAIVAELGVFRPLSFRLELDGESMRADAMLVAIGNGPSYGGGMRVCPGAQLDDGLLSVTVLHAIGKTEFLRLFPRVYRGTHVSHPAVSVHQASRVTVDADGAVAYADGERVGPMPVTATCVPGVQPVLVPGA